MAKYTEDDLREGLKTKETNWFFIQILNMKIFPVGLNEEIVRMISAKRRTKMDDQLASRIFQNLAKNGRARLGKY